jgi:general secretion pathway protein A
MYNEFFGLQNKPFSITPDPYIFFENRTYAEAYANLLYGVHERKGFLLLTGEVGTGKTTILRRLMDELTPTARFVFFYNTSLTFDELLTFVCEELQLKVAAPGQLAKISALNELLLDQLRKGSTAVLFIDEAQNLREEVFESLRLLSNLETSRDKLLQIILSGQPELEAKLEKTELRQLKQRIFSHSRLEPLSDEEVVAFVDYRLKTAGCRKKELFAPIALAEIARYSNGIPRLINVICDNALLIAYAESQKCVGAEIIREVACDLGIDKKAVERHQISHCPVTPNAKGPRSSVYSLPLQRERMMVPTKTATNAVFNNTSSLRDSVSVPTESLAEYMSGGFCAALTQAFTEAIGPMGPFVIREQLNPLKHGADLSKRSIDGIIESLCSEILDDVLQNRFRMTVAALLKRPQPK